MSYQNTKVALAAGESRVMGIFGRYFRVLENDNASNNPTVRIGNNPGQEVPKGIGIDLFDGTNPQSPDNFFASITITNPDAVNPMNLTIATSNAPIEDNRFTASSTLSTKDTNSDAIKADLDAIKADLDALKAQAVGPSTAGTEAADQTLTAATATKIIASGTPVTSIIIHADFGNTDYIYLAFSNNVSATRKFTALKAGMTYQIDNYKGDVYAYSPSSSQKVSASYY